MVWVWNVESLAKEWSRSPILKGASGGALGVRLVRDRRLAHGIRCGMSCTARSTLKAASLGRGEVEVGVCRSEQYSQGQSLAADAAVCYAVQVHCKLYIATRQEGCRIIGLDASAKFTLQGSHTTQLWWYTVTNIRTFSNESTGQLQKFRLYLLVGWLRHLNTQCFDHFLTLEEHEKWIPALQFNKVLSIVLKTHLHTNSFVSAKTDNPNRSKDGASALRASD